VIQSQVIQGCPQVLSPTRIEASYSNRRFSVSYILFIIIIGGILVLFNYIQGDSQLEDITAGGNFLGLCEQKSSYKHVSDFGQLQSYDRLKLRMEGNDYWQ
jgi:hypothetical protein